MTLLLAASLFFTNPLPLDMPRAEAYLVRQDGKFQLEDRYNRFDLWLSRTLLGRWEDDDGRTFILYRLNVQEPAVESNGVATRTEYTAQAVALGKKALKKVREAVQTLSPCEITEKGRSSRQLPRGYKAVEYWQAATNLTSISCAFLPEKCDTWFFATWELVEGDDIYERMSVFEDQFLAREFRAGDFTKPPADLAKLGERELLRRDARHSVELYRDWHVADSEEFTVLDDLPGTSRDFVKCFTNELPTLRRQFAEVVPTPIDGSNALCVARIYATREEFLEAAGEDMAWSAAYWNPERRELVAYLPAGGGEELKKTLRHESFHQYLAYACAMMPCAPWLNEGYAQYFEDVKDSKWGKGFELTPESIDRMAESIPALLALDYAKFYEGTDVERRFKYRLAWSIAYFLENGAPKVRFAPFKDIKRDYVKTLLETHDMMKATATAIGNEEKLKLFVSEWKKFWKNM